MRLMITAGIGFVFAGSTIALADLIWDWRRASLGAPEQAQALPGLYLMLILIGLVFFAGAATRIGLSGSSSEDDAPPPRPEKPARVVVYEHGPNT